MGEGELRGSHPSKNLLLQKVISDENVANNGENLVKFGLLITCIDLVHQYKDKCDINYLKTNKKQEDTVGSRFRENLAYIAGFLDGDGSLMLQIKNTKDRKSGIRIMVTICFYQDSRHEDGLVWINKTLKMGYLSRRNDGMSELRINGFYRVGQLLHSLKPYIKFKKVQCKAIIKACEILSRKPLLKLSKAERIKLCDLFLLVQSNNYVTKRKKTKEEIQRLLNLTP